MGPPAKHEDVPATPRFINFAEIDKITQDTHLSFIRLALRLMIRLIQIGELFDVRETVDAESVLGVKWVTVHLVQSKCCLIGRAEFQESKSGWISVSETIDR